MAEKGVEEQVLAMERLQGNGIISISFKGLSESKKLPEVLLKLVSLVR